LKILLIIAINNNTNLGNVEKNILKNLETFKIKFSVRKNKFEKIALCTHLVHGSTDRGAASALAKQRIAPPPSPICHLAF
jgi:hypothetical protein